MKEKALGWCIQSKLNFIFNKNIKGQEEMIIHGSCDSKLKKERIEELVWLILKFLFVFHHEFEKDIRKNKKPTWLILPKKKL